MKNEEHLQAQSMRQNGLSIKDIAQELGVSKSTVSVWVRDIELSLNQIEALKKKNPAYNGDHSGPKARKAKAREQRLLYRNVGAEFAKRREFLHAFGCALYWAEGTKHRTRCQFVNSDPAMLSTFLTFIRAYFPNEKINVHVNCYTNNGKTVAEIEDYWSITLNIPRSQFWKTTTDNLSKYSHSKKSKNKLPYGTVKLTVSNVRVAQHIFGAIEQYGGASLCLD